MIPWVMARWITGSTRQKALKVGSVNAGKVGSAARIGLLELARPIDVHDQIAGLAGQVHPCRIADEPAFTRKALGVEEIAYRFRRHTISIECRRDGGGAGMTVEPVKRRSGRLAGRLKP